MSPVLSLVALFSKVSLLAVGGVNSTLPEISREVVQSRHWVTPAQFAQLYAIAQAAPGPNMLIAALIGLRVGGVVGGIAAAIAIITPSGILILLVSRLWDRHREARWRRIVQAALLPITAGLVLAAAAVLARQADRNLLTIAIAAVSTLLMWRTRIHPLWVLGGGVAIGLALG